MHLPTSSHLSSANIKSNMPFQKPIKKWWTGKKLSSSLLKCQYLKKQGVLLEGKRLKMCFCPWFTGKNGLAGWALGNSGKVRLMGWFCWLIGCSMMKYLPRPLTTVVSLNFHSTAHKDHGSWLLGRRMMSLVKIENLLLSLCIKCRQTSHGNS